MSPSAEAEQPKRHALMFRSEFPLGAHETCVLHRQICVEHEISDLPIYGVMALADGESCLPECLWIKRPDSPPSKVSLSRSPGGFLIVQGPPVLLGEVGTEVCLSLEIQNKEYYPSSFRGAVLLGAWPGLTADTETEDCQIGGSCRVPTSGGACPGCNYPRAYAHPSNLLEAFEVDQIYIGGTAVQVYPDPGLMPGLVQIVQRDGRVDEYPIPQMPGGVPPTGTGGVDGGTPSLEAVDRRLTHVSPRQLREGFDSPAEIFGPGAQAQLLEYAATLLSSETFGYEVSRPYPAGSLRELGLALAAGVVSLSRGYQGHLDAHNLHVLKRSLQGGSAPPDSQIRAIRPVEAEVRAILSELGYPGRVERVRSARAENTLITDDRRYHARPWASVATLSKFSAGVSRIRVALVPGEADHVRIYDLRVGSPSDGLGRSVLDHVPGYGPELVREGPHIPVPGYDPRTAPFMSRYLPGTIFAGQLREGVGLDAPHSLFPSDLLGGVIIDLGGPLEPLSHVWFVYQVEPGHLFCAVATPA